MSNHVTAGEKSLKASMDRTKYDSMEVAYALNNDILDNIWECISEHHNLIDEKEFFVVMQLASDPLLTNLLRRKFYACLFLPDPRPDQAVFLYEKKYDSIKRLWVLPNAITMEVLTEAQWVKPQWSSMQVWSRWFYEGTFWQNIRKQHDIDLLSREEFLKANLEELLRACSNEIADRSINPHDFINIAMKQVVNT